MSAREHRRLAAIVAADVVGYSRLMGRDESGTVARLRRVRAERLEPILAHRHGRIVKLTGDGALIEFSSAVEALSAAIEFQQAMAESEADKPEADRLIFRVGVHLGDVIVDDDDLYGDGVNVAARLEGQAAPGGIVVSGALHEAVAGKLQAEFLDLGRLSLKNIERQVQAYKVDWSGGPQPLPVSTASTAEAALPLPDKPSIAVLPFQNMSGDPEQEYFADGVVEDIITALSRFKSLFVIARNSSFAYKGRSPDIRAVGRELGVRYVLEGSVRKAASKVRITSQLIDSESGNHIWADRYDGDLGDVFALQDQITEAVAGIIAPSIEQAEIERALRKPPANLDAHDLYLRALALFYRTTKEGSDSARNLLEQAMALDADYAAPVALMVTLLTWRIPQGWSTVAEVGPEVKKYAQLAEQIDKLNPDALAVQARYIAYLDGRHEEALTRIERALVLNPNSASAWSLGGWVYVYAGQPNPAITFLQRAMRLNPRDPLDFDAWVALSQAYMQLERYDEALDAARQAAQRGPNYTSSWRVLAASLALTGRLDEAQSALATLLQLEPGLTLSRMKSMRAWTEAARANYFEGLRLAGLPE